MQRHRHVHTSLWHYSILVSNTLHGLNVQAHLFAHLFAHLLCANVVFHRYARNQNARRTQRRSVSTWEVFAKGWKAPMLKLSSRKLRERLEIEALVTDIATHIIGAERGMRACTLARAGYYVAATASTTETPCPAGKFSGSTGSSSCSSCPAGYMCPSNAMSNPQQCSPGRYSTGEVSECVRCPAGTFNSIHRATDCCECAAGWFNVGH